MLHLALGPLMQQGGTPAITGHTGVAAWVATNSADVLAYYPCDDAAPSSTMADESGNGRNGSYLAGVAAGTIDGETVMDIDSTTTPGGYASVADAAWLDSIVAIFCVAQADSVTTRNFAARDGNTQRQWQWRIVSPGIVQLLQVDGSNPTKSTGDIVNPDGTRHTFGVYSSGGTVKLYFDGASESVSGGNPAFETGNEPMLLGRNAYLSGGQDFIGQIGSFVFLSAADDATFAELHAAWTGA